MLDVAAVAEVLLREGTPDLPSDRRDLFCLLIALHDLGKIGAQFRAMLRAGLKQNARHWQVTEAWLREEAMEDLLCERLGGTYLALRPLVAAIAGHHGGPPRDTAESQWRMRLDAGQAAAQDARCFVAACFDLWPRASLAGINEAEAMILSWRLSGLTVVADWVGSNPDWFPAAEPPTSAATYLAETRLRAAYAVEKAGLVASVPSATRLFDFALRAMQEAAASIPLRDGPTLAIIEDETGAGKTEAALLLAQRMLLASKGRGLYLALPTMATADAMFRRARDVARRIFVTPPSLTLAHGRAGLSVEFREVMARSGWSEDVICGPWLADSRRRALLADVGVGTIDQALLGILPTRFATLRIHALASKILIVDEVHELGNPYLATELETLLRLHAMGGGSAILLTATLPLEQRARLSRAFEEGAGRAFVEDMDPAYPVLSIPGGAAKRSFPDTVSPKGPVKIARLGSIDEGVALIAQASASGAACVWVRNAVDDAIASVEALRAAGVEADLLHARYAFADRKRIEAAALAAFGPEGGRRRNDGRGKVIVSTQVLEMSLDYDFDVMVSDLAPVAALIQRAGRLWRHMVRRPAAGRPVPAPVLHVVAPDPDRPADTRWLAEVQPRGAWVYELAEQWRTAEVLFRAGEIVAPGGLRALIEAVHGDDRVPVPDTLAAAEEVALGDAYAEAGLARMNIVKIAAGYRDGGGAADDRDYPTRLGQETRALLLTRRAPSGLVPWVEGESRAEAELLSEVSARATQFRDLALPDQSAPEIAAFTEGWPDWKRVNLTVCPVEEGGAICEGLRYDGNLGLLFQPRGRGDEP
ncbi:CRISPR-associated helicase Cas3' [Amaricoccus solimangrovi]|uniref:CRISPR-associated helicase Cas3 n=2 Tax=Amaricoccus solimangrovi TaxID=2589815 RepID=A0A501WLH6_9RHOB|nr:CRISPR-associated helicase Cas3' [Amaricoccus solimangrovi]